MSMRGGGVGDIMPAARFEELVDRALALTTLDRRRVLLGICGPPGAGKSTLAERLVGALGDQAVHIGMDGFHLAQVELKRLGRANRKGAPDTFDGAGYVNLLGRLFDQRDEIVYAPMFRRDIEEPVSGAISVGLDTRLIVTEGNYLLLPYSPWLQVRQLLDEVWFLAPEEETRRTRLIARHQEFGRSLDEAQARAAGPDERNAVIINTTIAAADLVIQQWSTPLFAT